MVEGIRQRLAARPFEPFVIVTSSGFRHRVPTAERAGIHPRGSRVVVWFDDGGAVTVSGLHIAAVEREAAPSAR